MWEEVRGVLWLSVLVLVRTGQAEDLSLVTCVSPVYSPAGPSQALEMPRQVCSVL